MEEPPSSSRFPPVRWVWSSPRDGFGNVGPAAGRCGPAPGGRQDCFIRQRRGPPDRRHQPAAGPGGRIRPVPIPAIRVAGGCPPPTNRPCHTRTAASSVGCDGRGPARCGREYEASGQPRATALRNASRSGHAPADRTRPCSCFSSTTDSISSARSRGTSPNRASRNVTMYR